MVSTTFRLPATDIKSPDFTNLLVGFGQFLSHDNEFTPITRKKSYLQPRESYEKRIKILQGYPFKDWTKGQLISKQNC